MISLKDSRVASLEVDWGVVSKRSSWGGDLRRQGVGAVTIS